MTGVEGKPKGFHFLWACAGILVAPVFLLCAGLVVSVADSILVALWEPSPDTSIERVGELYGTAAFALAGLAAGAYVGIAQSWLVRLFFRVELGGWLKFSLIGSVAGAILAYQMLTTILVAPLFAESSIVPFHIQLMLLILPAALGYLAPLSACQYLALRRVVARAWLWIAAHMAAAILPAMLDMLIVVASDARPVMSIGMMLGLPLLSAILTGVVMYRLLLPFNRRHKAKRKVKA